MEICCICFSETSHTLPCSHHHCFDCLKRLIKKSNLCCICRKEFDTSEYKYIPPTHIPNLKLGKKTIQFFNKFLSSRYLLKKNKHQKYYASLMSAYHSFIFVDGKYINSDIIPSMNKYDILQLYLYFKGKNNIFHYSVKQEIIYAIEMYLCCPQYHESYSFLNQMSSLLSSSP